MQVNLSALVASVLMLVVLVRISKGSSLGASVNIELSQDGSQQLRAYYSVLFSLPCPSLDQLCSEVDCSAPVNTSPLTGLLPSPGWCLHQWQKTIPKNYTLTLKLGSNEDVSLYTRADLSIRADTNSINRPPYIALPPPVRLRAGCSQVIPLSVMDLDGDYIRCRYRRNNLDEFLQLNEETCTLLYEGGASPGLYTVKIIVEDFPSSANNKSNSFSTVSLQLTITVQNDAGCPALPEFTSVNPAAGQLVHLLPFEDVHVNITVYSRVQELTEVAVIGPSDLYISAMTTALNFRRSTTLSWVRGPDPTAQLISVCFVANTKSLQSDIRCLWLQQTLTDPLPPGTELKCKERERQMSLVLPVSFLENLHFSELHLNDPTCPVFYNSTHITTTFSLIGCGTKTLHLGSELLYTNTLRSVNPNSTITRAASLVLPLACRIPAHQPKSPSFNISMPTEVETFGAVSFWLEFHIPGEGPMAADTRHARLRSLQPVHMARDLQRAGKTNILDLHVFSNCSLARAELMVSRCVESESKDFLHIQPLLNQGCASGSGTSEVLTSTPSVRIYRLYLSSLNIKGDTMYVECEVHLCAATKKTQRCADPCTKSSERTLVDSVLTHNYKIRSGPVSLINKTTVSSTTSAKPTQNMKPIVQPATSQSSGTLAFCSPGQSLFWIFAMTLLTFLIKS
ncbi:uncharacterized protein [Paramisgurnus dabryanus]|uniref:uncharacterized protein n=1 Tax=Paramisgurnus dabryanus TaxID=90735 RepID=UPI003CCF7AEF